MHDGVVGGRVGAREVGVHGSGGGSGHWSVVMQPMLSFIRCLSIQRTISTSQLCA